MRFSTISHHKTAPEQQNSHQDVGKVKEFSSKRDHFVIFIIFFKLHSSLYHIPNKQKKG